MIRILRHVAFLFFAVGFSTAMRAGPQPLHTNAPAASAQITNPPVIKIGIGVFQIGKVELNKEQGTVRFPALVNMRDGNIEYVIVHSSGKVHESLFKTDAEPYHINVALLLLGAKGGSVKTKTPEKKESEINGNPLQVFATWTNKVDHTESKVLIEDLVWDVETKSTAARGHWTYNGSRVIDGTFLAQRDGSIVSAIADPDALINNPRPGRDNDDAWQVHSNNVPPVNTAVQIIFQLQNVKQK